MKPYSIKPDYEHRTVNATVEETAGDYWHSRRLLLSHYAQHAVYELAASLIQRRGLKTALDVGCGLGHKLDKLVSPHAQRCVGIDQPTCIDVAKNMLPNTKIEFASADFEQPGDTGLGTFDLVMSVDVIEHLLDPDLLLAFIKAHCHVDSIVLISTPERDLRRGKDNRKSPKAEHVREWNQAELAAYLDSEGFEVIDHVTLPAFRVGFSYYMIKERWRLLRKGIPYRYSQAAVCQLKKDVAAEQSR
jgi:2-polyprenyl-3-methyl-5-hydroxy-6-metoxy-1,4-benzoquinol methylase